MLVALLLLVHVCAKNLHYRRENLKFLLALSVLFSDVNSSDVKHCTVLLTALEDVYSGTSPGLLLSTRHNSQCTPGTSPILLVGYSVLLSSVLGGDKVGV